MKLSDGPSTSASVEIEAPADTVFRIVSDLNTPAHSSSEFRGAEWLDGAEPGVGARFRGRNEHPAIGAWETVAEVVAYEPNRVFGYEIPNDDGPPGATWQYTIDERDAGVLLTQSVQMGPGPSGISKAIEMMPEKEDRILQRRLQEHTTNIEANLQTIKRLAEEAGAS
ncbi:SRPBCC family protein [Epidermidibacterium keratini]|uniref:SRPBCC family protein n=1 Tax=Epidermidibacterium keratini TaxID=1891644 RepID=A0A7L4YRX7_9ACTN|nr:SRPBCC family protein [Epidermidibacterium keratini]QHC02001.1 SRPBCC family protein [Epidermidibacterium keratini]